MYGVTTRPTGVQLARQPAPLLALVALLLPTSSPALDASVVADSFSIGLGPAATNAGFTLFFTTFDGSTGTPLQDCGPSTCTVSGELSPSFPGSSTYRTDYVAQSSQGTFEYGTIDLTLVNIDGDGDGLPDALERARSGRFILSGPAFPHFNAFGVFLNSYIFVSGTRTPGSNLGHYSGTFRTPTQTVNVSGSFALGGATGTVSYDLGGSTLIWNLIRRGIDGVTRAYTGVSQLVRIGDNVLQIPSFSLAVGISRLPNVTRPATLLRTGNVFRGIVNVIDGEPITSWNDYQTFLVELTDTNDTDSDGLPDIVSLPEARAVLQALAALITILSLRGIRGVAGSRAVRGCCW